MSTVIERRLPPSNTKKVNKWLCYLLPHKWLWASDYRAKKCWRCGKEVLSNEPMKRRMK